MRFPHSRPATPELKNKANLGTIVWAGNHDLSLSFLDSPADNVVTGTLSLSALLFSLSFSLPPLLPLYRFLSPFPRKGVPEMKKELVLRKSFDEIDEKMDQFFIRLIDGKLIKERMVRLPGGMPSTVRDSLSFFSFFSFSFSFFLFFHGRFFLVVGVLFFLSYTLGFLLSSFKRFARLNFPQRRKNSCRSLSRRCLRPSRSAK